MQRGRGGAGRGRGRPIQLFGRVIGRGAVSTAAPAQARAVPEITAQGVPVAGFGIVTEAGRWGSRSAAARVVADRYMGTVRGQRIFERIPGHSGNTWLNVARFLGRLVRRAWRNRVIDRYLTRQYFSPGGNITTLNMPAFLERVRERRRARLQARGTPYNPINVDNMNL